MTRFPGLLEVVLIAFTAGTCLTQVRAQTPSNDTRPETNTGSIAGRVVSEGQGVADATVIAIGSIPLSQPRRTNTDRNGNFVFDGLDRALYSFSVSATGYVVPSRDPDSPATFYRLGESAQLNLIKGGVITGKVLNSSDDPVVLVVVRAILVRDGNGRATHGPYFQQRFTDDRGVYRIYGLVPGTYIVSAAGGMSFGGMSAYDGDAPTFAPSSTRDTAAQIQVSSGSETPGVDIRYRGDVGHAISGTVTGQLDTDVPGVTNLSLAQVIEGQPTTVGWSFMPPGIKTFSFFGMSDGDYDLSAQQSSKDDSRSFEIKRITVKGADVTGIEMSLKPFAAVNGRVVLAKSGLPECKDKREPFFSETLVTLRSQEKVPVQQVRSIRAPLQTAAGKTGEFQLRNLRPGQYSLTTRFFAKYWYLKSIVRPNSAPVGDGAKTSAENSQIDLAKQGISLKFGDNISGVTVNLAEGAASLRGSIKPGAGERLPERLLAYLVPAEKEAADDVLRFFVSEITPDGLFAFNNLPPGRYWAITQGMLTEETQVEMKLRLPSESARRARLRRDAEVAKLALELKPCQNLTDYVLTTSVSRVAQ